MNNQPRFPERGDSLPSYFKTWKTAQTRLSKRDSGASYETNFRQSLVPPPLDIRPITSIASASYVHDSKVQEPTEPSRVYDGSASKLKKYFGAEEVTVDFSQIERFPVPTSPRSRAISWRTSLNRFSLTPSELPYPAFLRTHDDDEDQNSKAEEMLGIRRVHIPPPVPPKDPRRGQSPSSKSSDSSLPLYKESIMPSRTSEEPLNGRTAWLHALTGMLVVFNCWGLGNSFGLFEAYYTRVLLPNATPSAVAWIGSTQLALVFGLGVPVGRLVDKGYFRTVFHGGSVIMILGMFLTSTCTALWSLWLVSGLITGLGMGACFCSGIVALMTWFEEKKMGSAMALAAAGSCIGGIVYVLLARHLLATKGYKTTMLVLAAVATVTMIPANLVFRVRGQKHRSLRDGRRNSRSTAEQSGFDWRTFVDPSYLLAAGGLFFSFLGVYFGFVYLPLYASTVLHLSDTASTNLLIFMLAANLPGRFLPALISDRCIGPLNTMIPSVFLSSAVIWLWSASGENQRALTVIACFYGFVSAGIQALYAPIVHTFCFEPKLSSTTGTKQVNQLAKDRMGIKAGAAFSCIGVASLIGLPIGGALISYRTERDLSQPYLGAQIFAGVCLLVGGALLLASRVNKIGWVATRA